MSMQTSMFADWVNKFFGSVVGKLTELYNGKKAESGYLYEQMLDEEYSADLTWSSTELNNSIVAADVVSMDSSLPLKRRGTIRTASGDIPKIGIKKQLKEKAISDVAVMRAKGQSASDIAAKILNNVPKVIAGVKVRLEIMFEQALSTGYCLVSNEDNDGTGIRANFGYADSHIFNAIAAPWHQVATATPLDDIRQMVEVSENDGNVITDFYLSKMYFDFMRKSQQVKELVATSLKQVIVTPTVLPVPARQATLNALEEEFNATFHVVNNSYVIEDAAGNRQTVKPWEQGHVVGLTTNKVGRLVYGTLAEDMNRVNGVNYQKSGFILVSEYSHNEPSLAEFTAAQALAMPVIDDGASVYVLHADCIGTFSISTNALTFKKGADTVGQKVIVHTEAEGYTAVADQPWVLVAKRGETVTVKVAENETGAARTANVTITDALGASGTVAITQNA